MTYMTYLNVIVSGALRQARQQEWQQYSMKVGNGSVGKLRKYSCMSSILCADIRDKYKNP
jgi:hypothetical protein